MRRRAEHGLWVSLERELWGGLTRFREMDRAGEMWGRPYQTPRPVGICALPTPCAVKARPLLLHHFGVRLKHSGKLLLKFPP